MCDIVFCLYCILQLLHANLSRLTIINIDTKQHLYKVQNTIANQYKLIKHHEEVKWVDIIISTYLN